MRKGSFVFLALVLAAVLGSFAPVSTSPNVPEPAVLISPTDLTVAAGPLPVAPAVEPF